MSKINVGRRGAWFASILGGTFGALALLAAGCDGNGASAAGAAAPTPQAQGAGKDRYVIGMVAKSASNPVYLAARAGAEAAARDLGEANGIQIEVVWRSPAEEDSARQYELITETANSVDGLAISATDAALVTPAIDGAMVSGVQVVTFDADAPESRRIAFYGIDDREAGALVFRKLADVLGGEGRVAVLAGNRAAENIRDRVIGAAMELRNHEGMEIVGVFHHEETPEAANRAMVQAHENHGPIDGWALVGGWPLYSPAGLDGVPEDVKIVSMDPLPPALDHAAAGRVHGFVAQPYYGWGYESVKTLVERLHKGAAPDPMIRYAELEIIDPDDAERFRERWVGWVGTPAMNNGG